MVKEILVKELKKNINKYILIDVRTPVEFAASHIKDSYNLPLEDLGNYKEKLRDFAIGQDKDLVFICRSGSRSKLAIESLCGDSYLSLKGGILEWNKHKYPVIDNSSIWDIQRQVMFVLGILILIFSILGFAISKYFHIINLILGCCMTIASITNFCALALLLAKLPINKFETRSIEDLIN